MSSREIIWQHAKDYGWMRRPNYDGNPWADRFTRGSEPPLLVRYTQNGRVLSAHWGGLPIAQRNRDGVLDALEAWAQTGSSRGINQAG